VTINETAIREWSVWNAEHGPKAVRKLLQQLHTNAIKAQKAVDKRTRDRAILLIEKTLAQLDSTGHPSKAEPHLNRTRVWTSWEAATSLRTACHAMKLGFGLPNTPITRDAATLERVAAAALSSLPAPRNGRPATQVNPRMLHIAASLERESLLHALDGTDAQNRSDILAGPDRAASRLRETGHLEDTPLGRVASVARAPIGKKS
jgi:hypothetical protein